MKILYWICIGAIVYVASLIKNSERSDEKAHKIIILGISLMGSLLNLRIELFVLITIIILIVVIQVFTGRNKYLDLIVKKEMEYRISIIILILTLIGDMIT